MAETGKPLSEADVRRKYESRFWHALDAAVAFSGKGSAADEIAGHHTGELAALVEEIGRSGWGVRVATVESPVAGHLRGLMFYRLPEATPAGEKPIEAMTDRELLVKLDDLVYAYDRSRDEELRFLEKNPVRDAWDTDQCAAYKELCGTVNANYRDMWKVLDHIDRTRRGVPEGQP